VQFFGSPCILRTITIYYAPLMRTALQWSPVSIGPYRPVVVARLLNACNARWGFTTSADRQPLAGFVRRGVRRGFCSPDLINTDNLVSDMDDKLLYSILKNKHHVLHQLLPPERSGCGCTLRPRRRELSLTKKTRLDEQNFICRLIYKETEPTLIFFIVLLILSSFSYMI